MFFKRKKFGNITGGKNKSGGKGSKKNAAAALSYSYTDAENEAATDLPLSLQSPLARAIGRVLPEHYAALARLELHTVRDLLYHFPVRYGDTATFTSISSLTKGSKAVIYGRVTGLKASKGFRTKMTMAQATITDDSGSIRAVWFNQPYIAKMLVEDALVRAEGQVSERRKKNPDDSVDLYLSNPKIERVDSVPEGRADSLFVAADPTSEGDATHTPSASATPTSTLTSAHLYPVYPETRNLSSYWLYHKVRRLLTDKTLLDQLDATDPLPAKLREEFHLPSLKTALIWIHQPQREEDAATARKRFAFEEMLMIQLINERARRTVKGMPTFPVRDDAPKLAREFLEHLPYKATPGQVQAIDDMLADFKANLPMCRLLEGDVGSGKTLVAAVAAHTIISSRPPGREVGALQAAYMCPTEILATQHFASFMEYFGESGMASGIQIALITGSGCKKFPSKLRDSKGNLQATDISRAQLSKWVANGEISIVIGTHALIQEWVQFRHLALVIIDEQHRFGTAQRAAMTNKERERSGDTKTKNIKTKRDLAQDTEKQPLPHLLSMTATPIPRTLMLTIFGDLDLSVLADLPAGRKKPITEIVGPQEKAREAVYERVRSELAAGRQAYVICPRIDEPDPEKEAAVNARSVVAEAARLKKEVFPEYEIAVLHGKMTPAKKEEAMHDFTSGRAHILCATSVVEVGVNVPNATTIIIEGGERFGLAQLHQLRGRVMRSSHQPYCFIFTSSGSGGRSSTANEKTADRMRAFSKAADGFALAEYDLSFRGPGELLGGRQWGLSDIAMEALKNPKLVEAARTTAKRLLDQSPTLAEHPILAAALKEKEKTAVHLE